MDLVTIGEAVVIGVGVERIGSECDLVTVVQPVVVRVGIERIGPVDVDLVTIGQAVVIGVGVERIGPERDLLAIGEAIVVRIGVEAERDFADVRQGWHGCDLRRGQRERQVAGSNLGSNARVKADEVGNRLAHERVDAVRTQ